MSQYRIRFLGAAAALLLSTFSLASPSHADSGAIRVAFTKGGFIVGVGAGQGVLTFRGHTYPFTVSGMSVGFTFGGSTTYLVGHALHLHSPTDLQGTYGVIGAGGALAGGAGGVQLQNQRGVVLQLAGGKVGLELSAAVGGVTIALQ